MQRTMLRALAVVVALSPAVAFTQSMSMSMKPTAATYITKEEVETVHALPGTDRTIKVVEIGGEHFSVGTIHRGATNPPGGAGRAAGGGAAGGGAAAGGGGGRAGGAAGGGGAASTGAPCGQQVATVPTGGAAGMIAHDSQTEGYLITSGGGTLITGGKIVNGRQSAPDAEVTTTLNGPSCSGTAIGADIVRRVVKVGDIIIIPAGVPHGWTDIGDHVDYLSFRPSGQTLTAGYVNPAIKK
jgi:mannose-6-phosphate isomerase-like protein (cupin superfamily)